MGKNQRDAPSALWINV